jgi:hypothetical protein
VPHYSPQLVPHNLLAAVLPRARPPSLARCPVGPTYCRQFPSPALSLSLSLYLCLAGSDRQSPSRCPAHHLFSLCAMGLPCQFCLPCSRRGPARAHSRTSPDFSATTPTHMPSSLFRAPLVPRTHPSPHFARLHPLSHSVHATSRRRRPLQASPSSAPR